MHLDTGRLVVVKHDSSDTWRQFDFAADDLKSGYVRETPSKQLPAVDHAAWRSLGLESRELRLPPLRTPTRTGIIVKPNFLRFSFFEQRERKTGGPHAVTDYELQKVVVGY